MKRRPRRDYSPPFAIERAAPSRDHLDGWVVFDATNRRCEDERGGWLWARRMDAQQFVRELMAEHKAGKGKA